MKRKPRGCTRGFLFNSDQSLRAVAISGTARTNPTCNSAQSCRCGALKGSSSRSPVQCRELRLVSDGEPMSALPPKADCRPQSRNVRYVLEADIMATRHERAPQTGKPRGNLGAFFLLLTGSTLQDLKHKR